jgi:NADH-quinone oxidoreductase subunit D
VAGAGGDSLMKTIEEIKSAIETALPDAAVEIVPNPSPSGQHSLRIQPDHAVAVAKFLRDDAEFKLDYLSNVTGVDWPGYLEAVYHLYSVEKKHGPVILRMRTVNRTDQVELPSLTPVWRSAEFQEREIFDLFGIVFTGHPDLRRLLMWDGFKDHPMRRDYVEPDDFDYEPTAHDEVLRRAQEHKSREQGSGIRDQGSGANDCMSQAETKTDKPEGWNRRTPMEPRSEGELLEIAMGPHHPSTHGVFRMDVTLDGERVVRLKPVFGYLHRNHEKIAESVSYLASMPYTDRLDYMCSLTNNWAYALAVEKLIGQEVPERAEYLRVILGELTRFQNHASSIGFLIQEMGASGTPLMYAFREREKILDLFEELTGARMMVNYMRFGGCRVDATPTWLDKARKVVADLPRFVDEFDQLLCSNEILMARTQGVGVLRPELAINAGVTGPMLRASGVNYDVRKVDGYGIYNRFPFRVPLGDHWDVYDRFMVRLLEMRESLKILEVALKEIPGGPVMDPKARIRGLRPKPGEAYGRIESPKGELGFYLISDGGPNPYRYRVRPPSLINLTILEDMCLGHDVADVVLIFGSVDIILGEVDR